MSDDADLGTPERNVVAPCETRGAARPRRLAGDASCRVRDVVAWSGRHAPGNAPVTRQRVLICYDVASDRAGRRRYRKVLRILAPVAERVQRSVFLADLTPFELARVVARLRAVVDPARDDVRCFEGCARCMARSLTLCPKPFDEPRRRAVWVA